MEIPHAARPREVLRGYLGALGLRHPPTPTPSRGTQGGAGRLGAKPGSPQARVAGRSELGPARGIPAERRRQGDGGDDRRPGLPGPGRSGQVQRHPLPADPSRDPRGLYPPWDPRRAPRARDPARDPTHPGPCTPALRAPGSSTESVASPSPPPPPQCPQRPHAPHVPSRPAAAPVPAVAAARPPPSLCRRRSEPHTHRYTQPLTSPGPRPAHVTAETRLPADAAAVSGRPGDSEGGGRRRGRERSQRRRAAPRQPVPRARAPSGLLWLLAGCALTSLRPPSRGARLAPPPRTRGRLLSPAPSPARAPRCWPGAPSGRLAHGAVCGARRRQDVPSAPPPPPSFLPRVAQPAVWGRPRHARRRVETGQTRGRPGRWAAVRRARGEGAGRGRLHCARPRQLAAPGVRLGHPPNPPSGPQLAARPRPGGGPRAAPRRDPWGEPAAQTPPPGAGDPRATPPSRPAWRADVAGPLAPVGPPAAAALPAAGAEPRLAALGWPRPVARRPPSSGTPPFPHSRDRPDCPS